MSKWYQDIIKYYEDTVGTWPKVVKELSKIAKTLDKIEERNLLSGDNEWQGKREEFMENKKRDYVLSYPKTTKNLQIINQQLKNIMDNYDMDQLDRDEKEEKLKAQNKALIEENARLHDEYKYIKVVNKDEDNELKVAEEESKEIVLRLIALREQLALFKAVESAEVKMIINNLYDEIGVILNQSGIEIKDNIGIEFDEKIHIIIETKKTDDRTKVDTIAESLSPGYVYNDVCLREQKVILYVAS